MTSVLHGPLVEMRVREMVRLVSACRREFSPATELYADLSISGDDAAELFEVVSKEFGTSFVGVNFPSYFPNEPDAIWYHWWYKLSGRRPGFKPFTFGHLLTVVERGRWFEPSVTASSSA